MEKVKMTFNRSNISQEYCTMVATSAWFDYEGGGKVLVHRNCFKDLNGDSKRIKFIVLSVTYYTKDYKQICEKVFNFNL